MSTLISHTTLTQCVPDNTHTTFIDETHVLCSPPGQLHETTQSLRSADTQKNNKKKRSFDPRGEFNHHRATAHM